jgi:signal transduction histidine kinase
MARLNSIRARMTWGFVLVLAPFLLVTCVVLVLVSSRLDAVQTRLLLRSTVTQARNILGKSGTDWRDGLANLTSEQTLRDHEIGLLVLNGRSVVWRSSDGLPTQPVSPGGSWQVASRHLGPIQIYALHATPAQSGRRDRLLSELLILSLCIIPAIALGAWALVGRTLRPIHQLSQQAVLDSAQDLDVHLTPPSQDAEILELVGTLNGLLTRQAQATVAKGRFYAAASHELRTPLQALSGHLELALSRPRTAPEYAIVLKEAQDQTQRLIALVRALLLLHQLESPAHPAQEPTDLTAICDNALALLRPRLDTNERHLYLTAEIAESAVIQAAPTHAEILTRNLFENASRYTPDGGHIAVTISIVRSQVRLEVFNECVLPAGEDPQTWLEPFHRPDTSRTGTTGGNGLGLAICRALADANRWTFQLHREPTGIRTTVIFRAVSA